MAVSREDHILYKMNNLYGDLPPPKANATKEKNKETKGNEYRKNAAYKNLYGTQSNNLEINKTFRPPKAVQMKAELKKRNTTKWNSINEEPTNFIKKNKNITRNTFKNKKYETNKNENTNNNNLINRNGVAEKLTIHGIDTQLLDINNFVQSDLKKISEQLHKIQKYKTPNLALEEQNERSEPPQISYSHNYYEKHNQDVAKEMNYKQGTGVYRNAYNQINENHSEYINEQEYVGGGNSYYVMNIEQEKEGEEKQREKKITDKKMQKKIIQKNEKINNILYEKYFITHADEEYDPSKPNDLSKIIRKRKRKIQEKFNDEIQKDKMLQIYIELRKMAHEAKETAMVEPYVKHIDDSERMHSEKEEMNSKNYEEQFNGNVFYVKRTFAKGTKTHDAKNEMKLGQKTSAAVEAEKNTTQEETYDYSYNVQNEQKEENAWNENEETMLHNVVIPQMDASLVPSATQNGSDTLETPTKKNFAVRMMEKMGWKKGEGLGKSSQGITTPLILQKVNKRGGIIIQTDADICYEENEKKGNTHDKNNGNDEYPIWDINNNEAEPLQEYHNGATEKLHTECVKEKLNTMNNRYILLTNAFTSKELSASLQEEIAMEASQFGNLLNIHFVVDKLSSENSTGVNIVCEYESSDQANHAVTGLNKTIFKGKKASAVSITDNDALMYISNDSIRVEYE